MAGSGNTMNGGATIEPQPTKSSELTAFFLTTFIFIPGITIGFVGAFGFAIWMFQLIAGPPGPPG